MKSQILFPRVKVTKSLATQTRKLEEEAREVSLAFASADAEHMIEELWDVRQCWETLYQQMCEALGTNVVDCGAEKVKAKNAARGYYGGLYDPHA